ncbi:MAG: GNAT family N-acetyltransferase [Myxococcales bacterium]|nr:GNAT family N-acetyltransferase [Myxococcales bacterium]
MALEFRFIEPDGDWYEAEKKLRDAVLRQPIGRSFDPNEFPFERESLHFVAVDGDRLVGCVLFHPRGRSGRLYQMAVAADCQGQGLGRALVRGLEEALVEKGIVEVVLHARVTAAPFYTRLGYTASSEDYLELGIPHREMKRRLALC